MKKVYLFLVSTLLLFGNVSFVSANGSSYSYEDVKSSKIIYGYVVSDGGGLTSTDYGFYSFDANNPEKITPFWKTGSTIDAGTYYKGKYYVLTSDGKFGAYTASSGAFVQIADWSTNSPKFKDLTVDYSTDPPSLIGLKYVSTAASRLVTIDMGDGTVTELANYNTTGTFFAIACNLAGTVYVMTKDTETGNSIVQTLDKESGILTPIDSGVRVVLGDVNSMDFDHSDDKTLYIALSNSINETSFGTINLNTGAFLKVGTLGSNAKMASLYVPFSFVEDGAPDKVSNMTVVVGNDGAETADVSWTNPLTDNKGANLTSNISVNIYRNDKVIKTFDNVTPGGVLTYRDEPSEAGNYIYKVAAKSSIGEGDATSVQLFVGEDVPATPVNVVLTTNNNKAILNWTAPNIGAEGGWINVSKLKYTITRNPGAVVVTDNATGTTYTDESAFTGLAKYTYTVQAKTEAGQGGIATSNSCVIGTPLSLPYSCDFNAVSQFDVWTVVDANADDSKWYTVNSMAQYAHSLTNSADDWMISPSINLPVGKYKLSFEYRASVAKRAQSMKVYYGMGATIEAQKENMLKDYNDISNTVFQGDDIMIDIKTAGTYNFSFYAYSQPYMYNLQIDNVKVEQMFGKDLAAVGVTGEVYPFIGSEYTYNVDVKNNGSTLQNNYAIELVDTNNIDNVLATQTVTNEILPLETKTIGIKWTPKAEGVTQIKARIILDGDEKLSNNLSDDALRVNVQKEGVVIGTGEEQSTAMPLNFYMQHSASQIIYLNSEIGVNGGLITQIIYPYNNTNTTKEVKRDIKVYMANTKLATITNSWISEEEFTLVYSGKVDLSLKSTELLITLNTPFLYTGENICIMNSCPADDNITFINNIKFLLTTVDSQRAMVYANELDAFDFAKPGNLYSKIPKTIIGISTSGAGKISGTVKSSSYAVDGARVELTPDGFTTTTDTDGNYTLDYVPAGEYSVLITKQGYANKTETGVIVVNGQTTNVDFNLTMVGTHTITWENPIGATISVKNGDTNVESGDAIFLNTVLTITAEANEGYTLGSIMVNDNPLIGNTYTVVGDTEIEVSATLNRHKVEWINPVNAVVTVKDGTSDVLTGSFVDYGTELTISVTPNPGYSVGNVKVNGVNVEGETHVIKSDIKIVATVTVNKYAITWVNPEGVTISVKNGTTDITSGTTVNYNTVLRINTIVKAGYELTSFTVNDVAFTSDSDYTVIDNVIIAASAMLKQYPVTWEMPTGATLIVRSDSQDLVSGTNVNHGTILTIMASANIGYSLGDVTVNGTVINGNTYKVVSATTIEVAVTLISVTKYTVNYAKPENGTLIVKVGDVEVSNGSEFEEGTTLTISTDPDEKYELSEVRVNGDLFTGTKYTVISETTISALFTLIVSVADVEMLSLNLYPNPLKEELNIDGDYQILKIFDSAGKLLITSQGETKINVSNLTSGVYIIKAYDGDKIATYKMVK